ncbi:MAG: hypothetical protein L0Y55_00265 [Anaerolineales bacterium]|nr:hypothetical protein [Anaerolineales bacterium]
MKTKLFVTSLIVLLGIGLSVVIVSAQGPAPRKPSDALGTAFTYQGQLKKNGAPVTSTCDFFFYLRDASSGGNVISSAGATMSVVNGLFTREIDFGNNMFNGDARWLEISVRCSGEATYVSLGRQKITAAPYALALPGLYTQQNATSPNLIGGYNGNSVTSGIYGATIGGGGTSGATNRVTDNYGTVGGGLGNTASGVVSTIGGGESNTASTYHATVGGGLTNAAGGDASTVGGGWANSASGTYATVPGGSSNTATGNYSFAAGNRAKANHAGAFVWGDSTTADFASTKTDQFAIRATNGMYLSQNFSGGSYVIGERYRDNSIVAWASVWDTGAIDKEFRVHTITRLGTGRYQIQIGAIATTGSSLIPIAIVEVDAAPTSAATARIVTINQVSTNTFEVYINDGNWNLVDNDFVFIVTGR